MPGGFHAALPKAHGKADKARFMNMAEGSLEECRYYLILAKDLGYGETAGLNNILEKSAGC
jgi:four helix bundle protein